MVLKKEGMMRFFHEKTFFLDPRPLFFKWSTKPRLQCLMNGRQKGEVNYWVDFELKWVFRDPGISYRCPTQPDLTYTKYKGPKVDRSRPMLPSLTLFQK